MCPTGIDIRDGLQLECIQCGRCADACDGIMTSIKRPKGLIRTASEAEVEGIKKPKIRLRPIIYSGLMLLLATAFIVLSVSTSDIKYTIVRQPSTTYVDMGDGYYSNYFQLKAYNQTSKSLSMDVSTNESGVEIICGECKSSVPSYSDVRGLLIVKVPYDFKKKKITLKLKEGGSFEIPILLPN